MKLIIINGPNLNLLGKREPAIYGTNTFQDFFEALKKDYLGKCEIEYFQSNHEGALIDKIHETGFDYEGIILNAGAYTHTSIALHDAIKSIPQPVIEVHLSNVHSREEFRHKTMIGAACKGSILGFGLNSYRLAIEYFIITNNTIT